MVFLSIFLRPARIIPMSIANSIGMSEKERAAAPLARVILIVPISSASITITAASACTFQSFQLKLSKNSFIDFPPLFAFLRLPQKKL